MASKEAIKPTLTPAQAKKAAIQKANYNEKYDVTRQVGPDPRDPRTVGPPCHGDHIAATAYRGSVTGSNGSAAWIGCERCKLRLSYTPAYGAHGLTRSPGPLPQDAAAQVEALGSAAPHNPNMRDKTIAYTGAENSLLKKLDHVRKLKEGAYASTQLPVAPKINQQSPNMEEMAQTGAKKAARGADQTSEELEAAVGPGSHHSWSPVSTPPS